jgi:hypothetical protein
VGILASQLLRHCATTYRTCETETYTITAHSHFFQTALGRSIHTTVAHASSFLPVDDPPPVWTD